MVSANMPLFLYSLYTGIAGLRALSNTRTVLIYSRQSGARQASADTNHGEAFISRGRSILFAKGPATGGYSLVGSIS